eukprot:scaffold194175_cov31-Tisochrysis_lutea.AAC.5
MACEQNFATCGARGFQHARPCCHDARILSAQRTAIGHEGRRLGLCHVRCAPTPACRWLDLSRCRLVAKALLDQHAQPAQPGCEHGCYRNAQTESNVTAQTASPLGDVVVGNALFAVSESESASLARLDEKGTSTPSYVLSGRAGRTASAWTVRVGVERGSVAEN